MREKKAQDKVGLLRVSTLQSLAVCIKDVATVKKPGGLEVP